RPGAPRPGMTRQGARTGRAVVSAVRVLGADPPRPNPAAYPTDRPVRRGFRPAPRLFTFQPRRHVAAIRGARRPAHRCRTRTGRRVSNPRAAPRNPDFAQEMGEVRSRGV